MIPPSDEGIRFWAEPGAPDSEIAKKVHLTLEFKRFLEEQLLGGERVNGLMVLIYASPRTYAGSRPIAVDSVAHFHTDTGFIHIPVTAPDEAWRHELIHAILYSKNPRLPFWIQEGTARLLQNAGGLPLCHGVSLAMPASLQSYRTLLLQKRPPLPVFEELEYVNEMDPYEQTALAAFFAFYLWNQGKLLNTVQEQIRLPGRSSFIDLTSGDLNKLRLLKEDFYRWLGTEGFRRSVPGC